MKQLIKFIKIAKKCYDKDRDHLIRINKTYKAGHQDGLKDFRCDDFEITNGDIIIYATGDRKPFCDGSSLSPDKIGECDIIPGAIIHDAFYSQLENIAKEWDMTEGEVQKIADNILGDMIKAEKPEYSGLISRIYYSAVRVGGKVYHWINKLIIILVILTIIQGCASNDKFVPGDRPDYSVEKID